MSHEILQYDRMYHEPPTSIHVVISFVNFHTGPYDDLSSPWADIDSSGGRSRENDV
jgi:hypothetical protein